MQKWNIVRAARFSGPSYDQAIPNKLALEPGLRQIKPVAVTGSITIRFCSRALMLLSSAVWRRETEARALGLKFTIESFHWFKGHRHGRSFRGGRLSQQNVWQVS